MAEKKYNTTIQLMRGLAVIMVVLQHSISRVAETNLEFKIMYFLNHIDVAVFFLIAGYLFEIKKEKYYQESCLSYIKDKAKALIIPYLFWSLILAIGINVIGIIIPKIQNILDGELWSWKEIIINTLLFKDYYVQHLWFIYVLFLFFVVNRIFKDRLTNKVIFGIIFFASAVLNHIQLNYIFNKFILHFAVFLIGRLVVKHMILKRLEKLSIKIVILAILLLCFLSELFVSNSFTYTYLGNIIYALSGTYCIYIIAKFLSSVCYEKKFESCLRKIGDYSFEIYLMHNPYISMIVPIVLGKFTNSSIVITAINTVLGITIPYYIAKILFQYSNITSILFGRKGRKR